MKQNFKLIALGLMTLISLNSILQAATGDEKRIAASTQNLVEQLTKSGYASAAQQVRLETQGIKTIDAYTKFLQTNARKISEQGLDSSDYAKRTKPDHKINCTDEAMTLGDSALEGAARFQEESEDFARAKKLTKDRAKIARIYTHVLTELNKQ